MENEPWLILLVEDDEDDYILTRGMLREARGRIMELRWVRNIQEALAALDSYQPDALLVDYYLSQETGLELIKAVKARGMRAPIILLTGQGSYEVDLKAMQAGAADFIVKGEATASLLERTIRYAIERHRLMAENLEQTELAVQRANELKTVLMELEMQRALLNAIIANAPSGIMMVDSSTQIVLANPQAERIYGQALPLGEPITNIAGLHRRDQRGRPYQAEDLPLYRSAVRGETFINQEIMIELPDGQQRFLLTNAAPLRGGNQEVIGAVAVFIDITEHKQAADDQRRTLAQVEVQRRLMQSREKERLRIAQDLHDGPLQNLIGITFDLRELAEMANGNQEFAVRLGALETHLQAAIKELRAFSGQLRPPALTPFGLEKAVESHLSNFQAQHPELTIHQNLAADGQRLNEEVRLALFRIYQELLNNIVRHSNASEVWVTVAISPDEVELEVRDNGCGFEVPDNWVEMARQGHLGLVGVQERAQAVNGNIVIRSKPGSGTSVRVVAPLED